MNDIDTPVETPVSPEVETQNPTPDAPETEVAQPAEPAKEELTPAEKEARALKRRVDRLTRERYEERAKWDMERQQYQKQDPEQPQTVTPEDIDRRAAEIVETREFTKQCNALVAQGKKEFSADFEASLFAIRDEGLQLLSPEGKATPFLKNILDSDAPHKLVHYLGQNPDVAAEIAELSPGKQARRLGKIEDELSKPPQRSKAPDPIAPLKGGGRPSDEPDPSDTRAWVAWRNKRVAAK